MHFSIAVFYRHCYYCATRRIDQHPRSNIKHGVKASYSTTGGLVLSFDHTIMDEADKRAFAAGKFEVYQEIILSPTDCQKLGIATGKITKGSGPIRRRDTAKRKADSDNIVDTGICKVGYVVTIKIGGAEHKNDWPNK